MGFAGEPTLAAPTKFNWSTAVITAPREPPTLARTRSSLAAAGFLDPLIVSDATSAGCYKTWRAGLSYLLSLSWSADWLLIAEDDCEFTSGLREWLEAASTPLALDPAAFNSLYCSAGNYPKGESSLNFSVGWREISVPLYAFGALAYAITPALARRFLADPPTPERPNNTDHAIGLFCKREGIPYRVHSPSFVRHIGFSSALPESAQGGLSEYRQAATWVRKIDPGTGDWEIDVLGEGALVRGQVTRPRGEVAVRRDLPGAG